MAKKLNFKCRACGCTTLEEVETNVTASIDVDGIDDIVDGVIMFNYTGNNTVVSDNGDVWHECKQCGVIHIQAELLKMIS